MSGSTAMSGPSAWPGTLSSSPADYSPTIYYIPGPNNELNLAKSTYDEPSDIFYYLDKRKTDNTGKYLIQTVRLPCDPNEKYWVTVSDSTTPNANMSVATNYWPVTCTKIRLSVNDIRDTPLQFTNQVSDYNFKVENLTKLSTGSTFNIDDYSTWNDEQKTWLDNEYFNDNKFIFGFTNGVVYEITNEKGQEFTTTLKCGGNPSFYNCQSNNAYSPFTIVRHYNDNTEKYLIATDKEVDSNNQLIHLVDADMNSCNDSTYSPA